MKVPWRLVLYILIPLGIVVSLFGWRILSVLESDVEQRMTREVEIIGRALQAPVQQAISEGDERRIQDILNSVFTIGSVYGAFVYDQSGRLLASIGRGGDDPRYLGHILDVLASGDNSGRYARFDDIRAYSAFIPVQDIFGASVGLIQINRDQSEILSSVAKVRLRGILLALMMVLVCALVVMIGHYIAQGRAVARLVGVIEGIDGSELPQRFPQSGPNEIAVLGKALNGMVERISDAEREIQERKAVERILREQALRNDRLISLGQLAAGIAHELGGPLSVISGRVRRLLRRAGKDGAEGKHASGRELRLIEDEVRRTEAVVQQLLDFGSRRMRFETTGIDELVEQVRQASEPALLRWECRLDSTLIGEPRDLRVQPLRLVLALRNLVANAARHCPAATVRLEVKFGTSEVTFAVSDRGAGIPDGMEDKIFEPFFTTCEEGHGLGLALVQQVVSEHRGIVRARSLAQGAEFRIILPMDPEKHD